jgi:L-rhamnose mutarotase
LRRLGLVIKLAPNAEEEYRRLHSAVWPGVLDRLEASGVRNYSIFLRDGFLFAYFEYVGDDYERDMAVIAADPETQRWWKLTDPLQQPVSTSAEGEWWAPMDEVFHMDGSP